MSTIYIIHYHLHPGGVTRIIESQVRGLLSENPSAKIVMLTGDEDPGVKLPIEVVVFDALNYAPQEEPEWFYKNGLESIRQFLSDRIEPGDLVHAHNINLGKNPVLTLAVYELALKGVGVVYHCHDFPQDRPENMHYMRAVIKDVFERELQAVLYPDLNNVAFLVLNSVDKVRLEGLGVKKTKIFHLANPVGEPSNVMNKEAAQAIIRKSLGLKGNKLLVTYPVRVIRRKNVGEFILLAQLFRDWAHWLITQPPRNPVEIEPYLKWKQFCVDQEIDVHFEVGERVDFETLMCASDACITTSVQEGFGMAFMEPWSYGTPVVGRDIPTVTRDLRDFGVQLPLLYENVNVNVKNRRRDFTQLTMDEQMDLIVRLAADEKGSRILLHENPILVTMLVQTPVSIIKKNQSILKEKFSISAYGRLLYTIYDSVAQGA